MSSICLSIEYTVQLAYTYARPIALDNAAKSVPKASQQSPKYISYEEVQKHNTRDSCWVIIDGQVYDATSVLRWHPAGPEVILQLAGQDATYDNSRRLFAHNATDSYYFLFRDA